MFSSKLAGHIVNVAVECRCYEKEPVGIKDIDAFYGFLDDVGANKGVLISNSGFTKGAENRADGSNLELQTLTFDEATEFNWDSVFFDCQNPNECWGSIHWEEYLCEEGGNPTPPPYKVGHCSSCGAFHLECGHCGNLDLYEEERNIQCSSCDTEWELEFEDGLLSRIRQINNLD